MRHDGGGDSVISNQGCTEISWNFPIFPVQPCNYIYVLLEYSIRSVYKDAIVQGAGRNDEIRLRSTYNNVSNIHRRSGDYLACSEMSMN